MITLTSTDGRNKSVNIVQIVTEHSNRRISARFFRVGIFDLLHAFGVEAAGGLLTRPESIVVEEGTSLTEISFVVVAVRGSHTEITVCDLLQALHCWTTGQILSKFEFSPILSTVVILHANIHPKQGEHGDTVGQLRYSALGDLYLVFTSFCSSLRFESKRKEY